jgi:hypothetical protein
MCKHVVRDDHVGSEAVSGKAGGGYLTKEGDLRLDALAKGHFGDVARGFYPQNRNAAALKILQQISIIAGDLYNLRRRTEAEARHHHRRVIGGMTKPRVGELPAVHPWVSPRSGSEHQDVVRLQRGISCHTKASDRRAQPGSAPQHNECRHGSRGAFGLSCPGGGFGPMPDSRSFQGWNPHASGGILGKKRQAAGIRPAQPLQ